MSFFRFFILAIALLALPVTAQAEKITVVASFSILGDIVREIAGDNVRLVTLVGPNSDAHAYEPTPADVKILAGANLVVVNGLGFEGWMERLVKSSDYKGALVTASDGIETIADDNVTDPHAWQNITNGKVYVINILQALSTADPAHAPLYSVKAAAYISKLSALDTWVRSEIVKLPREKRRAIIAHNAMGYYGKAYGVSFVAPLGVNTASDVGAHDIARLIDLIRAKKVRVVFMENMHDPRLMQQLVKEGGAVLGGTLYSDALSAPGGDAPDYATLLKYNTTQLLQAMKNN